MIRGFASRKTCERLHDNGVKTTARQQQQQVKPWKNSTNDRLTKSDEEARDEKEESSNAGARKPSPKSSISVTATDKVRTETTKDEQKPKKPPKVPVLVIEINENTGKSVNSGGKTSDATPGAKLAAPTEATATSSGPKPRSTEQPRT